MAQTLHGSAALQALVRARLPRKPYCGDDKFARIRPGDVAIAKPFLQLSRPALVDWLIVDIDRQCGGYEWYDQGLPPPTYIVLNPANQHQQIGYALSSPVCTTSAAQQGPLRYLAAIEHSYRQRLGGDPGFNGPLSKNPLYPGWRLLEPAKAPVYELSLLAEYVTLSIPPRRTAQNVAGLGRNCTLFDNLARWARRAVRDYWRPGGAEGWLDAVLEHAHALNTFASPLSAGEVNCIGRSVARWTWRNVTPAGFRRWQSEMGRRGGLAKREAFKDKRAGARELRAQGRSYQQIANELGVCRRSVINWCK
jgi:hypothetical protein